MIALEAGKYYRSRDGQKVGPMSRNANNLLNGVFRAPIGIGWTENGTVYCGFQDDMDLIAEWRDEPVPHEYKVGDMVRIVSGGYDTAEGVQDGEVGRIARIDKEWIILECSEGYEWDFEARELEPYTAPVELTPSTSPDMAWNAIYDDIKQMLVYRAHTAIQNGDEDTAIDAMTKLRKLEETVDVDLRGGNNSRCTQTQ